MDNVKSRRRGSTLQRPEQQQTSKIFTTEIAVRRFLIKFGSHDARAPAELRRRKLAKIYAWRRRDRERAAAIAALPSLTRAVSSPPPPGFNLRAPFGWGGGWL